jgi:hypothetical protein
MTMAQHKVWRALMPLFVFLLVGGGLFTFAPAPEVAADGFSISEGTGPNNRPSMNVSPDSGKVCVIWSTFGPGAEAYIRIYFTGTNTWSPPLSQPAFQVSRDAGGDVRGTTRCAIDGAGRVHAVWTDNAGERLRYSRLEANADPGNGNNWTQPITIGAVADAQNPDVMSIFADANGTVWLAYWSIDAGNSVYVKSWTNGSGWSGDTKVSDTGGKHPRIAGDNAGYVHVIYHKAGSGIRYTYRDVATGAWSASVALPGSGNAIDYTGLAVNREAGAVHAVYSTPVGGGDDTRVVRYVKKTGPTGTAFGNFVDLTGEANHVVPRLARSQSGKLTMVTDNRTDGTIEMVTSGNDGASWSGVQVIGDARGEGWPTVTMDNAGNSYVAWWHKEAGDKIFFARFGSVPNSPAPSSSASPSPSPSPSPAAQPPVISNVLATRNTLTSVTITWTTNTPSSSRVFFGVTPTVDTTCEIDACTAGDPALVTQHAVTIRNPRPDQPNLRPDTTYNFQVRSTDAFGQATLDPQVRQFTTPSLEIVGNGKTADGRFAALVWVPAGVRQLEWSVVGSQTFTPIQVTTTSVPQVIAFAGDITGTRDPLPEQQYTIYVRYNGNPTQISTTATIQYNPNFKIPFSDVDPNSTSPYAVAIYELQGRGIVQGANGQFRPIDPIARVEASAIVTRALGWVGEEGAAAFSDLNPEDPELEDNVQVLADYGVAQGFGDGTFQPNGNIAQAQIISLITRAMVAKGYWQFRADDGSFPEIPASSGHRVDIVTFNFYTNGALNAPGFFSGATYAADADRRFVARVVYETIKWREGLTAGASVYTLP